MPSPHRRTRPLVAFLLALALIAPTLANTPLARADGCVVTNSGDGLPVPPVGSLRDVLSNLCAVVTFQAGLTQVNLTARLPLDHDVTITGPGAAGLAIRYTGASAADGNVLWVRAGNVTLKDLTISGGQSLGTWGAGLTIGGTPSVPTVTLDGVTVTGNTATSAGGGGIYATHSTLTIRNSLITGNTVVADSTAGMGGGLILDNYFGPVTAALTTTTVSANTALQNNGGGIYVWARVAGTPATLSLTDSTVAGNHANNGGGLYVGTSLASIINSTISGNIADNQGGGLIIGGGDQTMAVTLTNSTISGNTAAETGGLVNLFSKVNLTAVTVVGNHATAATTDDHTPSAGGLSGFLETDYSTTNLAHSIVAGNTATSSALNDCAASTIVSQGYNLIGNTTGCPATGSGNVILSSALSSVLDPSLANNGGPTLTHALVAGVAHERGGKFLGVIPGVC